MASLTAQIASSAFTVADPELLEEGIELYAFVSGPYISIGARRRGAWGEPLDDVEIYATVPHSGERGLYEIEAVVVYEEALIALRDFRAGRGAFADDDGEEE